MSKGQHRSDNNPESDVAEESAPAAIAISGRIMVVERMLQQAVDDGTVTDFDMLSRRGAVMLLTNPDGAGTAVRCPQCLRPFMILNEQPPDWRLVGLEFVPCLSCMIGIHAAIGGTPDGDSGSTG